MRAHTHMIPRGGSTLGALTLAIALSGCTTLVSLLEPNSPKIYGGTRMSLDARARASAGETPSYGWSWYPLMLVDLPISVAFDTALLPVTVFLEPDAESRSAPRASRSKAPRVGSEPPERKPSEHDPPELDHGDVTGSAEAEARGG